MSRKGVASLLGAYFVVALVFGVFEQLQTPLASFDLSDPLFVGKAFGTGVGLYLGAGAIPLIVWACLAFNRDRAPPVFYVWVVLGVILGWLGWEGHKATMRSDVDTWTAGLDLRGKDRDIILTNARSSCVNSQRSNALNLQIGVTDQQITVYCNCFADAMVKAVTVEELRYSALNGKLPDSLQEKMLQATPKCANLAFGRR